MNELFADENWKVAEKKISSMDRMGAWDVVEHKYDMNVINGTCWCLSLKTYFAWNQSKPMSLLPSFILLWRIWESPCGDASWFKQHSTNGNFEVLCLKKTLYGLHQSPIVFCKYLTKKLCNYGLLQAPFDPCHFISKMINAIYYIDYLIFWARNEQDIDNLAVWLHAKGVDLEQEDGTTGFLNITQKGISLPVGNSTIQTIWKPFVFKRRLRSIGSSCIRLLLLSNLGTYSPKELPKPRFELWTSQKELDGVGILCCIDTWEGVVILAVVCFSLIRMKKGRICNHQFSQDWNDILHACASRINPYLVRTSQNQFFGSRIKFFCSQNIVLDSREHSQGTKNSILDSRTFSLEHRTKSYLEVVEW